MRAGIYSYYLLNHYNSYYCSIVSEEEFDFHPGELPMPPKVRARAVKALNKAAKFTSVPVKKKKEVTSKCCSCSCYKRGKKEEEIVPEVTELTPELMKANNEGWKMIQNIAFPSLPALFQDLWVYLELLITITAFGLGMVGFFPVSTNVAFQYVYFVLTIISMILAFIDAFMYFIELGSCARAFRYYKDKLSSNSSEVEEDDDTRFQKKTCFSPEVKEKINLFFELGRTILSELMLYPLLIFDMFSFVTEQSYQTDDAQDRTDFGLFIIGSFYLILAVYIMRMFVLVGSALSLIRLPANDQATGDTMDTSLIIKFCLHSFGQIIVHLLIVLVVGAKINNEKSNTNITANVTDMDDDDPTIRASRFLWASIALGWLLPIAGTTAFFIVNYYWMREFSIGFWLNMISLLQGASFAETVFGDDGLSETKDKALEFVQNSDYKKVKKQLSKFKSPPWWIKFFYPARVPVVALCGIVYDLCLISFIASLMLTYDDGVKLVILKDDDVMTSIFFISTTAIILANIHILFLLNSLLIVLFLGAVVIVFSFIIITSILLFLYFPLAGLLGYLLLLKQLCCCTHKKHTSSVEVVSLDNYNLI